MIRRMTIKAALTNFNWTYVAFLPLAILTLVSLASGDGDLLFRISVANAGLFGLLTGTTLTEIKVKPLSWCLPGQESSMGPAIVILAAIVSLVSSAFLLLRPMTEVDAPLLQQFETSFAWSFGLYLTFVAVAVYTRDTLVSSQVVAFSGLLLIAGYFIAGRPDPWAQAIAYLAGSPVLAALFAATAAAATLYGLGSRERSRRLCGAAFLPLKAFDHPARIREYRAGLKRTSLRPSVWTDDTGTFASALLAKLGSRAAGGAWDLLTLDSRLSGNVAEFFYKLLIIGLIVLIFSALMHGASAGPFPALYIITSMMFIFFVPGLTARLSPMLPVSRGQRFRSLLAKSSLVYVTVVVGLLAVRLVVGALGAVYPEFRATLPYALAELPLSALLILALNGPIHCWGFAQFRSAGGWLVFFMVYSFAALAFVGAQADSLLEWSLSKILLITAIAWLPFVAIGWKRCFRDDLLHT
jgi:hypothetical protein